VGVTSLFLDHGEFGSMPEEGWEFLAGILLYIENVPFV